MITGGGCPLLQPGGHRLVHGRPGCSRLPHEYGPQRQHGYTVQQPANT